MATKAQLEIEIEELKNNMISTVEEALYFILEYDQETDEYISHLVNALCEVPQLTASFIKDEDLAKLESVCAMSARIKSSRLGA